jgi:polar amino acid transport system substrate-binding protein
MVRKHNTRVLAASLIACLMACVAVAPSLASSDRSVMRSAWYLWDPYQYLETRNNLSTLTGLDIALVRAIASTRGVDVSYEQVSWREHIEGLKAGDKDLAAGATWSAQRAEFVWFSKPYRSETNVLYVRPGRAQGYDFRDVSGMLERFEADGFRLGIVSGYVYADPQINAWIADPANAANLVPVGNDYANLQNLADQEIDGFLGDQIAAATSAWRGGFRNIAEAHPLQISAPIHLMFSKKTVSEETVAQFNAAIEDLEKSGEFRRIVSNYMLPVLLMQTLDRRWFTLIDYAAIIAFALSGVILAHRGRYDFFGALVLAALPAVGGGLMRDLIAGRSPPALVAHPEYLYLVAGVVSVGYVILKLLPRILHKERDPAGRLSKRMAKAFNWTLTISDAAGLAFLTVIGVVVAIATEMHPLWLWGPVLAMLGGGAGGILRDIVRQDQDIPTLKGEIYPEIALVWGLFLSLFMIWQTRLIEPDHIFPAILVTMFGAFFTRIAIVLLRLKSPLYG